MLEKRDDETVTQFTLRQLRAAFLEEAVKIVLEEAVDIADCTDTSYNTAIEHAADALRASARNNNHRV